MYKAVVLSYLLPTVHHSKDSDTVNFGYSKQVTIVEESLLYLETAESVYQVNP